MYFKRITHFTFMFQKRKKKNKTHFQVIFDLRPFKIIFIRMKYSENGSIKFLYVIITLHFIFP